MPKETLPREFAQALDAFNHFYNNRDTYNIKQINNKISTKIYEESGCISVFPKIIKVCDVPAEPHWKWNQAKTRQRIPDKKNGITVEMFKVVTRRKSEKRKKLVIPFLKIWFFIVLNEDEPELIIWCERGLDSLIVDSNSLHLSDYSFLKAFMDPCDAEYFFPASID